MRAVVIAQARALVFLGHGQHLFRIGGAFFAFDFLNALRAHVLQLDGPEGTVPVRAQGDPQLHGVAGGRLCPGVRHERNGGKAGRGDFGCQYGGSRHRVSGHFQPVKKASPLFHTSKKPPNCCSAAAGGLCFTRTPFDLHVLGAPPAIRTHDLQSRSLTLYPTELRAHIQLTYYIGYFRVLQGETEKTKKYSKFRKKDVDISPAR